MKEKAKNQRRILVVDKDLQYRMIKNVSIVPIASLVIGTLVIFVFFWIVLQGAVGADIEVPGIYGLVVAFFGLVFVSSCIVTLFTATRFSNRIAGPLYRLHKAIEQALGGDRHCKVVLREGDYLMDTAEKFNQLLDYIETLRQDSPSHESCTNEDQEEPVPESACSKE